MTVPPVGRRGPRRDRATDTELAQLVADARTAGEQVDQAQAALDDAVARRREAVRALSDAGVSVRAIADALALSTNTVQRALHP